MDEMPLLALARKEGNIFTNQFNKETIMQKHAILVRITLSLTSTVVDVVRNLIKRCSGKIFNLKLERKFKYFAT